MRIAGGFPYTPPVGLRVAASEDGRGRLVPSRDGLGNLLYAPAYGGVENLNSGRVPYYARFDVRATYHRGGSVGWSVYVEVLNLLGRDNPVTLRTRLDWDADSDVPRIVEFPFQGFPRIPSFGLRYRF